MVHQKKNRRSRQMPVSRRRFLKGLGSTAIALPFVQGLSRMRAMAEGGTAAPIRFIGISNPHGTWKPLWRPRVPGNDSPYVLPSGSNFTFDYDNAILAPLEELKSELIILDGIDYRVYTEQGKAGHEAGMKTMLTGCFNHPNDSSRPNGMSIDQYLAGRINDLLPLSSLELGVYDQGGGWDMVTMCYGPGGRRLPNIIDPVDSYNKLFPNGPPRQMEAPDEALLLRNKRTQSLLDFSVGEIKRVESELSGLELEKFQIHLNSLKAIENRIALQQRLSCSVEGINAPIGLDPKNPADVPDVVKTQMDLIVQAFSCDITRVATLQIFSGGGGPGMPWLGPEYDVDIHNGIAHNVIVKKPSTALPLAKVQRWYADMFAYMLKALRSVPEGDGTMLDNTIIYWTNELGEPAAHRSWDIPVILAGGGGGKLNKANYFHHRDKRFCDFPRESPKKVGDDPYSNCRWHDHVENHVPHNKVLTTICHAMGYDDVDYFGDERFKEKYNGTLSGILI